MFQGASWHKPDHYFVLYDLEQYVSALLKMNSDYRNAGAFARKQAENALNSAFFSSDRAIATYAEKIWKIDRAQ